MNKLPLVSVLITNYNNEKFIDRSIESCINQSYLNNEIIFYDDYSTDNSVETVKNYKTVKLLDSKRKIFKEGSYSQINAIKSAFDICKGEIICLLDSDDFFELQKLEKVVNYFNNNNSKIIWDKPINYKYDKKITFPDFKPRYFSDFLWPRFSPTSCISIRREFFQKILYEVDFQQFPNIWLDFRLAVYCQFIEKNFVIIDQRLTNYQTSTENVSSKYKFLNLNWWKRRKEAHEYMKFFLKNKNIKHLEGFDYFITKLINYFL